MKERVTKIAKWFWSIKLSLKMLIVLLFLIINAHSIVYNKRLMLIGKRNFQFLTKFGMLSLVK